MTRYRSFSMPIGKLLLAGDETGIERLAFMETEGREIPGWDWQKDELAFDEAARQLRDYFAGKLRAFDLVLSPSGTSFQQAVWKAVAAIPYGQKRTYAELAQQLGRPNAARAVGAANAANPIPIIIPCHRVVGSNGALTGYLGGIEMKQKLLHLEQFGRLEPTPPLAHS